MAKGLWSRAEVKALLLFVVLSALIGQAQRAGGTRATAGAMANAAAAAARPGHKAVAETGHLLARLSGVFARHSEFRLEEAAVSTELAKLRLEVARLKGVEQENRRLRRMLAFTRETDLDLVPAEVLGGSASPWFQSVIIDLGSADGVRPGMAVTTYQGLVGQVFRVQSKSADVCLLSDPDSSVSVVDTRSRVLGVVRGTNTRILRLTYLRPDADVQRGDKLMTAGVGGVYPRGLGVGTVTRLSYDAHTGSASAQVTPEAGPGGFQEVLVCKGPGGG